MFSALCLNTPLRSKGELGFNPSLTLDRNSSKARLTGTWDNRNVTQQAKNLWAEEGAIPNVEEFVEKNFGTRKALLLKRCDNITGINEY